MVLAILPKINCATDFGCGVGTWLSVLQEYGVQYIDGFDGTWVPDEYLRIPKDSFHKINFEEGIILKKRYDLAISLEVAEHLSEKIADKFIALLTSASDFILFSAAIPFQGGDNHINEQWPNYWNSLFNKNGYIAIDFLRRNIWNETSIPYWYKQNTILFVNKEKIDILKVDNHELYDYPLSLVHPEKWIMAKQSDINLIPILKGYKILLKRTINKFRSKA
jgi:hypothetical protein